jgi:hypothetical protein
VAVRTYLATGRVVEIGAPFGDVDYRREVAEPLARINRYHGQCADEAGNPLSVAEHCVHGSDALARELSAAGWPVVSKPQPDALTIVGRVKVATKGETQSVSLRWEVKSPGGKTLGDVKQANDVPLGSLDQGWGPAAIAVAEAAATGIFDIVKRYR